MTFQNNKLSDQVEAHPSKRNPKNSPLQNTTGKTEKDVIYTKDKSPDDLEILD